MKGESEQVSVAKREKPLLEVEGLKQHFPVRGGVFGRKVGSVKAVDGISLKIGRGETLGRKWVRKVDFRKVDRTFTEPD